MWLFLPHFRRWGYPSHRKMNYHNYKNYKLNVSVQHSKTVVIKADSKKEAIEKTISKYNNGDILPQIKESLYCDGLVDVSITSGSKGIYNVKVIIQHSDTVELESDSERNAIKRANLEYYKGNIMNDLIEDHEYFNGVSNIKIIEEGC